MKLNQKISITALASLTASAAVALAVSLYFLTALLFAFMEGSTAWKDTQFIFVVFLVAVVVAGAHVLCLGLPAVWVLHKFHRLRLWTVLAAGFVTGCIPVSVLMWPVHVPEIKSSSSYWNGREMVQAEIDGIPTLAGWIDYLQAVALMGLLGMIAALSFWLIFRRILRYDRLVGP